MNISEVIQILEQEWDSEGFLGRVRSGNFDAADGAQFLELLSRIQIDDSAEVPKRLLTLLWYVPVFLQWQARRVSEMGGDLLVYNRFVTEVLNTLESVLGVP